MTGFFKASFVLVLAIANVGCADANPASNQHYKEYVCTFGSYGRIVIHQGGFGRTYIIVRGKKYPASGGMNFIQGDDDPDVVVMFDRKGNLYYKTTILGKDCKTTRR